MADQQKGKNRAAILQELESIKGLLVDEEDIPVLQEVIEHTEAQLDGDGTLDDDDLQELQQAYRDLLQAQDDTEPSEAVAVPTPEVKKSTSAASVRTEVQTSLFDGDLSQPEDEADATSEDSQVESTTSESETAKQPVSESRSATPRRPGVTKATGENPFLPAHIRARLHGNRPPPLFEPLTPTPATQNQTSKNTKRNDKVDRAQLIDDLVTDLLPQIEAALRTRLKSMTEEQLQQLVSEESHPHETPSQEPEGDKD